MRSWNHQYKAMRVKFLAQGKQTGAFDGTDGHPPITSETRYPMRQTTITMLKIEPLVTKDSTQSKCVICIYDPVLPYSWFFRISFSTFILICAFTRVSRSCLTSLSSCSIRLKRLHLEFMVPRCLVFKCSSFVTSSASLLFFFVNAFICFSSASACVTSSICLSNWRTLSCSLCTRALIRI